MYVSFKEIAAEFHARSAAGSLAGSGLFEKVCGTGAGHRLRPEGARPCPVPSHERAFSAGTAPGNARSALRDEDAARAAVAGLLHRHRLPPAPDPPGIAVPDRALLARARPGEGGDRPHHGPGARRGTGAGLRPARGAGAPAVAGRDQREAGGGFGRAGPRRARDAAKSSWRELRG